MIYKKNIRFYLKNESRPLYVMLPFTKKTNNTNMCIKTLLGAKNNNSRWYLARNTMYMNYIYMCIYNIIYICIYIYIWIIYTRTPCELKNNTSLLFSSRSLFIGGTCRLKLFVLSRELFNILYIYKFTCLMIFLLNINIIIIFLCS